MVERFPDEFITWQHTTYPGIHVDEVFGMDSKNGKIWNELALQIFKEMNGDYREVSHFSNGAPYIEGYAGRISLTHTNHFLAVAILPKTPETDLSIFKPRTAMGIDAESLDRTQVLKVRPKFLSEAELLLVPEDNLEKNIIAWTSKEAIFKAGFKEGVDFINDLELIKLPEIMPSPLKGNNESLGEGNLYFDNNGIRDSISFKLFSYESYGCCVTLAYNTKIAKFSK